MKTKGIIAICLLLYAPASYSLSCARWLTTADIPIQFNSSLRQTGEPLRNQTHFTFEKQKGSSADWEVQPRVFTEDRWPSSGRQAGLDPRNNIYTDPLDIQWAAILGTRASLTPFHQPQLWLKEIRATLQKKTIDLETFSQVYLSHDRKFAITYSSSGNTRIFDAHSGKLLTFIKYQGTTGYHLEGIISVSREYFVLGHRAGANEFRRVVTLRRFDNPMKVLFSYDTSGTDLTSVVFNPTESKLILGTLSWVSVYDIPLGKMKSLYFGPIEGLYSSSGTLAADGKTYWVGFDNRFLASGPFQTNLVGFDLEHNLRSSVNRVDGIASILHVKGPNTNGIYDIIGLPHYDVNSIRTIQSPLTSPTISVTVTLDD